jgi:magnesium-transporting ATPase (P-type)
MMGTPGESTEKTIPRIFPNGPIWSGILAAGIGCTALGALVDLAEASKSVSNALNFYNPTGDLSGKTLLAVIIWLVAWVVLHARWRNREIQSPGKIMMITLVLVFLALIAVFPPFFSLFASD